MKVLLLNGSPHPHGNTALALAELEKVFAENGVETELIQVGSKSVRGCIACGSCNRTGKCVFEDLVNETAPKFAAADGIVVASPVYYASPNATLIAFLDRLFYSTHFDKTMKVGASVVVCRRGGAPPALMCSTSTSPSATCPSLPANTGTACTAVPRARPRRMPRGCRPCGCSRGI